MLAPGAMANLRSQLDSLAAAFANAVVDAIRGASLQELVATDGRAPASSGRASAAAPSAPKAAAAPKASRSGRLKRRSNEDIGKILDEVVALVKKNKDG